MNQEFLPTAPARMLAAVPNFRDIGGLRGAAGRRVRSGMVYRSGAFDALLDDDMAPLAGLGIKLCCDLRTAHERASAPNRWPAGAMPRLLELEFTSDVRALSPELMDQLAAEPSREAAIEMMLSLYRSMPATCAPLLAQLLPELADAPDAFPLVIHCTAGKDRTGFVIAVLLAVLGVAPADIRADYLRSNLYAEDLCRNAKVQTLLRELLGMTPDPLAVHALTRVFPEYLDAALDELRRRHGTVERYLSDAAGVDAAMQERLRQRLLQTEAG